MSIQVDLNIKITCDKCSKEEYRNFDSNYGNIGDLVEDTINYYEYKYVKYNLLCLDCQEDK